MQTETAARKFVVKKGTFGPFLALDVLGRQACGRLSCLMEVSSATNFNLRRLMQAGFFWR